MGMIALVGGCIFLGCALIGDVKGTLHFVTIFITIRGIGFICQRIAQAMNKEHGDMINFASWSIAGVAVVGLIKNALLGIKPLLDTIMLNYNNFQKLAEKIEKIALFIDKLAFWN